MFEELSIPENEIGVYNNILYEEQLINRDKNIILLTDGEGSYSHYYQS